MESEEGWFGIQPIEKSWFKMDENPFTTGSRDNFGNMFDIRLFLSDSIHMYTRSSYSSLDILTDVGGLIGGLRFTVHILL